MRKFLDSIDGANPGDSYLALSRKNYAGGRAEDSKYSYYNPALNTIGLNVQLDGRNITRRHPMDGFRLIACHPSYANLDTTASGAEETSLMLALDRRASNPEILHVYLKPESGISQIDTAEGFYYSDGQGKFELAAIRVDQGVDLNNGYAHQTMVVDANSDYNRRRVSVNGGRINGSIGNYQAAGFYDADDIGDDGLKQVFQTYALFPNEISFAAARLAMRSVNSDRAGRLVVAKTGFVVAEKFYNTQDGVIDPMSKSARAMGDQRFIIRK
jgi:hypothetical protein